MKCYSLWASGNEPTIHVCAVLTTASPFVDALARALRLCDVKEAPMRIGTADPWALMELAKAGGGGHLGTFALVCDGAITGWLGHGYLKSWWLVTSMPGQVFYQTLKIDAVKYVPLPPHYKPDLELIQSNLDHFVNHYGKY